MYTPFGRQQRANLIKASELGNNLLALLRPTIETVPKTVITRTKSDGTGEQKKTYSPYKSYWSEKRRQSGLQTSKKDFWFSGEMWNSYQIVQEEVTGGGVSYTLGTTGGMSRAGSQFLSDIHGKNEGQGLLGLNGEEWNKLKEEISKVINTQLSGLIK